MDLTCKRLDVQKGDGSDRVISFIASTDRKDRQGDTIDQSGWVLTEYKRNPIVLWAHDRGGMFGEPPAPPIARADKIRVTENGLEFGAVTFPPEGAYPFADTVLALWNANIINTVSVGFKPIEWKDREGGTDYLKQELFEVSLVPIPANPEARRKAEELGASAEVLKTLFGETDKTKITDALKLASDMTKNFSVIEATVASVTARLDDVIKRVTTLESPTAAPDTPAPGAEESDIPDWLKSKQ